MNVYKTQWVLSVCCYLLQEFKELSLSLSQKLRQFVLTFRLVCPKIVLLTFAHGCPENAQLRWLWGSQSQAQLLSCQ